MNKLLGRQTTAVSLKKRVFSIPTLLSFGIASAFVFFLATRLDLDWSDTWANIREINPWQYVLAIFLYYLSFLFRGIRWRMLARNAGVDESAGTRLPSVLQCSQLIILGWFVNSVTWLRLGDAYRAYAFAEDSKGSFPWSLGTVLAERVLDTALIFGMVVVSALFLTTSKDSNTSNYVVAAAFAMALVLVAGIVVLKVYGARAGRFLPRRIQGAYDRFRQGTLGSFKQLPMLSVLGFIAWLLEIGRLYFVIEALNLEISLALIPVVALGHAILSTVPTPGGVGAVEPGVTGLLLIGLGRNDAVSVALVDRSITYISVILFGGLVFLVRQVLHARRLRRIESVAVSPGERSRAPDDET